MSVAESLGAGCNGPGASADVAPTVTAGSGRGRLRGTDAKFRCEDDRVGRQFLVSRPLKSGALLDGESRREAGSESGEFEHRRVRLLIGRGFHLDS
ncbi:hypothetical protein [Streptomyces griseoluteus]|uniref:hypothetical protein n=1 Tax=Streptomyces griseoluteus TaxID=29306 RepID=UPI00365F41D8